MASNNRSGSGRALLASILALIILLPLGYSIVRGVIAIADEVVTPEADPPETFYELPDPDQHPQCVIDEARGITDTRDMRLKHWELLKELRVEVVRYGKRGELDLNKCAECHTSRERFCQRCHEAASVKPDCWGCHYYP